MTPVYLVKLQRTDSTEPSRRVAVNVRHFTEGVSDAFQSFSFFPPQQPFLGFVETSETLSDFVFQSQAVDTPYYQIIAYSENVALLLKVQPDSENED